MSRIISLEAENVKRLRAVHIEPNGNMVVIGGNNRHGKSSVLDSIAMALGGGEEIPEMPVRRGEEKARVILKTDDGFTIKRTFTKAGGTVLVIENADKFKAGSPQELLNKLTGKLTFDPLAFCNLDDKAQALALKKLVGLDFTALDAKRKALYDERTLVNRQAEQAKSKAEFMPQHDDAPAEEPVVTDIVKERDEAKEHNAKQIALERAAREAEETLEDATQGRGVLLVEIELAEKRVASLRGQLAEYDAKIPAITTRVTAAQAALAEFKPIDLSPINTRLANAQSLTAKVRQNKAREAALREAEEIAVKASGLTKTIEAIDQEKDELLAATKFPVAGLSFDKTTGGVLFNEVPFEQASAAERLGVSVAIAAALNPKLRVMLVRDGSLLDDRSLQLLGELAVEHNLQCWVERVGKGAECSVIIEDGAVEAAPANA